MSLRIPPLHELRIAEARRQKILDHLHANGRSDFAAIHQAMPDEDIALLRGSMLLMLRENEIKVHGSKYSRSYTAEVERTYNTEQALQRIERQAERTRILARDRARRMAEAARLEEAASEAKQSKPGHYIHTPGKHRPHGGQGAVRPRVYINCSHRY